MLSLLMPLVCTTNKRKNNDNVKSQLEKLSETVSLPSVLAGCNWCYGVSANFILQETLVCTIFSFTFGEWRIHLISASFAKHTVLQCDFLLRCICDRFALLNLTFVSSILLLS